ncbi:leucine-rich repeat protein, partial [bacterium]|nr:leucine-rich repeat protein [bacterium]
ISLTNITIPDGVTSMGDNMFRDCSSLTSIIIPNGVSRIGDNMFRECISLTNVITPNGLTSIGKRGFFGCSSLTSIAIPDGVTNIGFQAFYSCTSLTRVTFLGAAPTVGSEAFFGVAEGAEVIVPEGQRASFDDGAATWNGLTVSFAPDVEWDSVISYRSVLSPESIEYIVGGNNIRRIDEGNVSYWAPSNAGEEALLTQRFSFNENIEQAYLNVSSLFMVNFGDGRFGRGSLWASKDGSNWVQLLDVPTPSETAVSKSYSSNLPPELLGGDSLWIQTRLLANGLNIAAQFLRYDASREDNAFDLKVRFGDPALSLTVSPEIENVGARGGSLSFSVSSDTNWSWSDDAPWLTSNESPSQSGSQEFSYSVAPNSSTQSRTATITFSAGEFTRTHTVTQQGIINCEISALRLPSGGLDALQVSFPARSGVSYRIEESSDLQVWDVREAGISGDGIIIQRRIPARGPKGFLRVVEE